MAVIKSSTRKMYTHVNDTEAPGSRKSKKKLRLMASSAFLGTASLYPVHEVSNHELVALSTRNPKWLTRPGGRGGRKAYKFQL